MTDEEKIIPTAEAVNMEGWEEEPTQEVETNWAEEAQKFQDLYLRNAAETENMRRRFQKEREEQIRFAGERVIKSLLPVMDNLALALSYVKDDAPSEVKNLAQGVGLTLKGFMDAMAENGVQLVVVERGQTFDPNIHEALGCVKDPELTAGVVGVQVQPGYTLFGRLLRPATVMLVGESE